MRLSPSVQVGDKVFLCGWKHLFGKLKPRKFGHIERINGAYIYVRPIGWPKKYPAFQLYEGELRVVKRFTSRSGFKVGDKIRFAQPSQLEWGKARPRQFARVLGFKGPYVVVQPIGMPQRQFDVFGKDLIGLTR
jgi:hypothetical protein